MLYYITYGELNPTPFIKPGEVKESVINIIGVVAIAVLFPIPTMGWQGAAGPFSRKREPRVTKGTLLAVAMALGPPVYIIDAVANPVVQS